MAKKLAKPVGFGGANLITDVRVVQYLLNCVPYKLGGPRRELVIDGFVGPGTVDAIRRFQKYREVEPTGCLNPEGPGSEVLRGLMSFDPFPSRELPFTAPKTSGGAVKGTSEGKSGSYGTSASAGAGGKADGAKGDSYGSYGSAATGKDAAAGSAGAKAEGAKGDSYGSYGSAATGKDAAAGSAGAKGGGAKGDSYGSYGSGAAGKGGAAAAGAKGEAAGTAYPGAKDAAGPAESSSAAGKANDSSGAGAKDAKSAYQEGDPWGFYNPESPYYGKAGFAPNAAGKGDGGKSGSGGAESGAKGGAADGAGAKGESTSTDPWGFFNPSSSFFRQAGKAPSGTKTTSSDSGKIVKKNARQIP